VLFLYKKYIKLKYIFTYVFYVYSIVIYSVRIFKSVLLIVVMLNRRSLLKGLERSKRSFKKMVSRDAPVEDKT
jgi:heme exporter protein D